MRHIAVLPARALQAVRRARRAIVTGCVVAGTLGVLAAPARAQDAPSTYRLTVPALQRFTKVTSDLATMARKDPAVRRQLSSDDGPPPAVLRAMQRGGMPRDEYVRFAVAMVEAGMAIVVLENGSAADKATIPGITRANASFVKRNRAAFDALGPDLKVLGFSK